MIYRSLGQPNKYLSMFGDNARVFICFFGVLSPDKIRVKSYPHILFHSSGNKILLLLGTPSESQRYKLQKT